MVDIIKGQTDKVASSTTLVEFFKEATELNGKLYVGYPILFSAGESLVIDAIWISVEKGIVVFDLIEGVDNEDRVSIRDELYVKVKSILTPYKELNRGREFLVDVEVITYAPAATPIPDKEFYANSTERLKVLLDGIATWDSGEKFQTTLSVIQTVTQIKAKIDRDYVSKDNSKGAIIKKLEKTIANLDNQQEEAIITYFDGLQRIRGLAGSGKTIVLALKAAFLHARNPNWNIAITFNTRSLKNQFRDLIEIFCAQKMGTIPDYERIHIIHAWGSSRSQGIYYNYCLANQIEYYDFKKAKAYAEKLQKTNTSLIDVICKKALEESKNKVIKPVYDVILVDEAQDLSESFLNICHKLLSDKKRLVYAYDELQKLNEGSPLRNPKAIFNKDANDTILKKCYRNSNPVLVTAHALGFGIYKNEGLAQFFDQPELWEDVGYQVKTGELSPQENVVLERKELASHNFIQSQVDDSELIKFEMLNSKEEQAKYVADEIEKNILEDELLHTDIIVINPMALTTRKEVGIIRDLLNSKNIDSHITGDVDPDKFFEKDSIAFTGINRAKGNEVPMVYIINAEECYSHPIFEDLDLIRRRNILFTAITRSKAWVRVLGTGHRMKLLIDEFNKVKDKNFELHFRYPTREEIDTMNVIRRDLSRDEEREKLKEIDMMKKLNAIVERIKAGDARIEDYPVSQRSWLEKLL